jgi:hypothetical protein
MRQKEDKAQNNEDLSPEKHLEISVGSTDTSLFSAKTRSRVHFDITKSPNMPVAQGTRRKRGMVDGEVELRSSPPGTRKTLRSKGSVKVDSIAEDDINDPPASLPPVRKTRGTKLTTAVEMASSPARRKQGAEVAADAESSSVVLSKRRQGVTAKTNAEELSPPRTRRGGTITTGSELSSPPKRQRAAIVTVDAKPLPPRTRRRAIVSTEMEIPESPVTKKTRGKSTLKTAVTLPPVTTAVSLEDSFTTANKQLTAEASSSPAGKRQKRTKAVERPATKPARKLRGTKLSGEFCSICTGLEHMRIDEGYFDIISAQCWPYSGMSACGYQVVLLLLYIYGILMQMLSACSNWV